jgi:hypothetical protein
MTKKRSIRNLNPKPSVNARAQHQRESRSKPRNKKGPKMNMHVTDPMFAAIARHRAANDAFSEFLHRKSEFDESRRDSQGKFRDVPECAEWDEKEEHFSDIERSASDDLAATVPTTLEGVFAKMDYVSAEHLRGNHIYAGDDLITVISSVLDSGLLPGKRTKHRKHRRVATSLPDPDPVFAMIATHKKLTADWQGLYDQLQDAEIDAASEHGNRPIALISWRDYTIGASEIDTRHKQLLEAGEIDPATVEQEYLDAKARYQAQVAAGVAWDKSTGLATLRKDVDNRVAAAGRYATRLAQTMPTTPAGAAALIRYILDDDLEADESYWHMTALKSAVAALNSMGAAVPA